MKKLLLFLCIISCNTAWASSSAQSQSTSQEKKIAVRISCSTGKNTMLIAYESDKPKYDLSEIHPGGDASKKYYREGAPTDNGFIDKGTDNPNKTLVQAIAQATTQARLFGLFKGNIRSLWLVTPSEVKFVGAKDSAATRIIAKNFQPYLLQSLDKCITCRGQRRDQLRRQGETLDCDIWGSDEERDY